MEICKIKISKDLLQILIDSDVLTTKDFEIIAVEEKGVNYSHNEVWKALKDKSDKAYKELKIAEFKIRNG